MFLIRINRTFLLTVLAVIVAVFVVALSVVPSIAGDSGSDFIKHGNNGTASCNSYCGAANEADEPIWGRYIGSCKSAYNVSAKKSTSCNSLPPGIIPLGKEITCSCTKDVFLKHGNNGTTSCSNYCNGSQWGPVGTGGCVTAWNNANDTLVSCDTTPGFLPNGEELTCTCQE